MPSCGFCFQCTSSYLVYFSQSSQATHTQNALLIIKGLHGLWHLGSSLVNPHLVLFSVEMLMVMNLVLPIHRIWAWQARDKRNKGTREYFMFSAFKAFLLISLSGHKKKYSTHAFIHVKVFFFFGVVLIRLLIIPRTCRFITDWESPDPHFDNQCHTLILCLLIELWQTLISALRFLLFIYFFSGGSPSLRNHN